MNKLTATYQVRVGQFYPRKVIEITGQEWVNRLLDAHDKLTALRDHNLSVIAAGQKGHSTTWEFIPDGLIGLKRDGTTTIRSQVRLYLAEFGTKDVTKCISNISELIADINGPTRAINSWGVFLNSTSPSSIDLEICALDGTGCQKCGAILHRTTMNRHKDSPSCRARIGDHSNIDRNWVKISDQQVVRALQEAGIDHEKRPIVFGTWAPDWVLKAAAQYYKNQGYAGMSIKDYLLKIKP